MAEEYVKNNNLEWELECNRTSPIGEVIQAFLAGLKTGRPQWHKVADGDLPDNTDSVLSDKGVIIYYNFTHDCWVDERASVEIDPLNAWCEIPTFTDKE